MSKPTIQLSARKPGDLVPSTAVMGGHVYEQAVGHQPNFRLVRFVESSRSLGHELWKMEYADGPYDGYPVEDWVHIPSYEIG